MKKIGLVCFHDLESTCLFEIDTGQWTKKESILIKGILATARFRKRKAAIAVYFDEDKLFFQADRDRWSMTDGNVRFSCSRLWKFAGLANLFRARGPDNEILFETTYLDPYWTSLKNWLDPTYDELDQELDDVFRWLANNCNSDNWREEFSEKWRGGVNTPTRLEKVVE